MMGWMGTFGIWRGGGGGVNRRYVQAIIAETAGLLCLLS